MNYDLVIFAVVGVRADGSAALAITNNMQAFATIKKPTAGFLIFCRLYFAIVGICPDGSAALAITNNMQNLCRCWYRLSVEHQQSLKWWIINGKQV
jgi:hypothetical protein